MLIEDLRLPCGHGNHLRCGKSLNEWETKFCPGGRVPTRQKLIDALGGEAIDPLAQDAHLYSHLIPVDDS